MQESPLLSKQIKLLTVKIHSLKIEETGSGLIYLPKTQPNKIFIITAKHCLCGKKEFVNPESVDFEIDIFDEEKQYYHQFKLPSDSSLYFFKEKEKDIAIISFLRNDFPFKTEQLPTLDLVEDSKGIRNSSLFGFPTGSPNQALERIDTVLQLPTESNNWKAEPQRAFEAEEFDSTKSSAEGFSGSGFVINTLNKFFLFGIVTDFIEWNRFLGIKIHLLNELLAENDCLPEPFFQLETNEEIIKGISYLDRNTEIIRGNIQRKSNLGKDKKIILERTSLQKKIFKNLTNKKVVIINGNAGYGKSVLAEKTLSNLSKKYTIWAIKAEQLIDKNIDELLWADESKAKFQEILDSPLLLKEKVILIDSTEKLLETQELEGLESLLDLVNQRDDLKVLFTIRDYALGILITLPKNEFASVEVQDISDTEMGKILKDYPELKKLLANEKIKEILKTPFYLNFVLQMLPQLMESKDLDERKLKIELWKKIIEKSNISRGKIFQDLALKRAQEMSFYVHFEDANEVILKELLQDEIIILFEDKYGNLSFAPAHDIFEDWALVRYINKQRSLAKENLTNFYYNIGNAYAIRRGFRFWLQEELSDVNPSIFFLDFIAPSLDHSEIPQYWKDEILVAILLSSHCTTFLNENKDNILADNAGLLVRLIHLLRTACRKPFKSILKESGQNQKARLYSFNFEPIGTSWESIIAFIYQNRIIITTHPVLVLGLLLDWEKGLYQTFFVPSESRMVGEILLQILRVEKLDYFEGFAGSTNKKIEEGLALLLRLTEVMKEEVKSILKQSLSIYKLKKERFKEEKRNLFRRNYANETPIPKSEDILVEKFNGKILNFALSCFKSRELCVFLPDIVIHLAKELWLKKVEKVKEWDDISYDYGVENYFGLTGKNGMRYFPASAYQTPTYFLLFFHPTKGLNFLVNVVNHSTEYYSKSSFGLENNIKKGILTLNSGKKVIKWHNITLWTMYRSLTLGTAKPDILKSMMMALEKWMFELGKSEKDEDHKLLANAVKYLLKNSNSAMTTAVVSSVSMAYEFILKQELLPIFTIPEFFILDKMRWIYRKNVLGPSLLDETHHLRERKAALELRHRNDTLEHFILRLSLYQEFVNPVLSIIDTHYKEADKNDQAWLLALNRMDRRLHKPEQHPDNSNQIILIPVVKEELKEFVEEGEREREKERPLLETQNWAFGILKNTKLESNTFENWRKYQETVSTSSYEGVNPWLIRAYKSISAIAYIGLNCHFDIMDSKQRNWCVNTILQTGKQVLNEGQSGDVFEIKIGLFDEESVTKALPLILQLELDENTKSTAKFQILWTLVGIRLSDNLQKPLFNYLVEKLWSIDYSFANQCFRVLYLISFINKPQKGYHNDENYNTELKIYKEKVEELIQKGINSNIEEISSFNLNLLNSTAYYLEKTFGFLPEKEPFTEELKLFRKVYEKSLVNATYHQKENYYERRIDLSQSNSSYQEKDAKLLFHQDISFCKDVLHQSLKYILNPENNCTPTRKTLKLIKGKLQWLIYLEVDYRKDERFWHLWKIIYDESTKADSKHFSKILLFETRTGFMSSFQDWQPFHGNENFLKSIIQNFGKKHIDSVVKLVSGPGAVVLLPEAIIWIKQIIEEVGLKELEDIFYFERLVQRAFFLHKKAIQENSTILQAYIYLLNILVDAGSSSSFYLREIAMSRLN